MSFNFSDKNHSFLVTLAYNLTTISYSSCVNVSFHVHHFCITYTVFFALLIYAFPS